MTHRRRTAALFVAVFMVAAACSDDADDGATGDDATTTTRPDDSTSDDGATEGDGCVGDGATPPDAVTGTVEDVDGDGTEDEAWITESDDGTVTVGLTTAAGAVISTPFTSASPVTRSVLVTDADDSEPTELFLFDGRSVQLHALIDCEIVPVTNPEGSTYTFSLGFADVGTGVGCIDTPDGRRLVGLDVTSRDDEKSSIEWTRTIVELDGATATNGSTERGAYTFPDDDAEIELLHRVTCGDLDIDHDGIALPR